MGTCGEGVGREDAATGRGVETPGEEESVTTIHNRGRRSDDPLPIEKRMSWVDPKTAEPDFHVPSSLGWFEVVK